MRCNVSGRVLVTLIKRWRIQLKDQITDQPYIIGFFQLSLRFSNETTKIGHKFRKYSLSEITKIRNYHNESCFSRVSKKSRQAKNLAIDKKSTIVAFSIFMKLCKNIHLISTLCCWNISLIGCRLWIFR